LTLVRVRAYYAGKNTARRKKPAFSKLNFFASGKGLGLSAGELHLLYSLSEKTYIENPTALFWSSKQLENCIKLYIEESLPSGESFLAINNDDHIFLNKLLEQRKKLELALPRNKNGIKSSTQILPPQQIQAFLPGQISGHGAVNSIITENTPQGFTIQRPDSSNLDVDFVWKGKRLNIYFWRNKDAAYNFETNVTE
jgi:hypothetical protein